MKCSKCQSIERLEKHHQYPRCFYGEKAYGLQICLCRFCHIKMEMIYLSVESYVGDVKFGTRYKLERKDYDKITRHFLREEKIIYVAV